MKLISVTEALPTHTDIKLVYNQNAEWQGIGITEWNLGWYAPQTHQWVCNRPWEHKDVTHWCDLPETPGRNKEEELRTALRDMIQLIDEHGSPVMKAHSLRILKARSALEDRR